jgi:hypothetical protein
MRAGNGRGRREQVITGENFFHECRKHSSRICKVSSTRPSFPFERMANVEKTTGKPMRVTIARVRRAMPRNAEPAW